MTRIIALLVFFLFVAFRDMLRALRGKSMMDKFRKDWYSK